MFVHEAEYPSEDQASLNIKLNFQTVDTNLKFYMPQRQEHPINFGRYFWRKFSRTTSIYTQ